VSNSNGVCVVDSGATVASSGSVWLPICVFKVSIVELEENVSVFHFGSGETVAVDNVVLLKGGIDPIECAAKSVDSQDYGIGSVLEARSNGP